MISAPVPGPARPPALLIVAPCYNEEACLGEFFRRVGKAAAEAVGDDHEIVLIDDGSKDATWTLMQAAAAANPRLLAIRLSRNFGHQRALTAGQTGYPFGRMLRLALDAVTGFSVVPLRVASYCGALIGVASVLMLGYTFGSWLAGQAVNGWTSPASNVLLLGSVQLLVLGTMGEYLGRLFIQSKGRPLFIVQDIRRGSDAPGT
jgi:hypothetical protein